MTINYKGATASISRGTDIDIHLKRIKSIIARRSKQHKTKQKNLEIRDNRNEYYQRKLHEKNESKLDDWNK